MCPWHLPIPSHSAHRYIRTHCWCLVPTFGVCSPAQRGGESVTSIPAGEWGANTSCEDIHPDLAVPIPHLEVPAPPAAPATPASEAETTHKCVKICDKGALHRQAWRTGKCIHDGMYGIAGGTT